MAALRPNATYADLETLSEDVVGELIDGELFISAHPAGPHAVTAAALGIDVGSAFHRGRGGPGGWWILDEPELHFGEDVLVPDLAGWKRERMPSVPEGVAFTVPPDWVCEVASPDTTRIDRMRKLPIYAKQGVAHVWLVDPLAKTIEAFALENGRWTLLGVLSDEGAARIPPFEAVALELPPIFER